MNYNFDMDDKKSLTGKILKEILIWMIEIGLVIALSYLLVVFAAEKTTVIGDSMETTLQDQDQIIINKLAYRFSKPKRFDSIIFKQNGTEHNYYIIKRIIGLPGETVQIIDGLVYINDKVLTEPIPVDKMINGGLADEKIIMDENEYFVLGDSRNNSEDSRFANVGNVILDDIIGKAWIRLKPFAFVNQINKNAQTNPNESIVPKKE